MVYLVKEKIFINCDQSLTDFPNRLPILNIFLSHYPTCSIESLRYLQANQLFIFCPPISVPISKINKSSVFEFYQQFFSGMAVDAGPNTPRVSNPLTAKSLASAWAVSLLTVGESTIS